MMEWLRAMSRGWVAKILLGLLVLSFAVWGIADVFRSDLSGAAIVSAGNQTVTAQQYRLAYEREVNVLSRQFGQRLTSDQARQFGVEGRVYSTLVTGAVLDAKASDLNLGLSKDRLATITAEEQAFFGADGRFDRNQFQRTLANVGMTESDYFDSIGKVARRQQMVEAIADGAKVPTAFLEAFSMFEAETRDITYLTLPVSLVQPVAAPSDAQVTTYFDENKTAYRIPEYRGFKYVKLEPSDIQDKDSISDEAIRADYDANIARYTTPESRTFEQIVFTSQEDAQKAVEEIAAGKTFEDILTGQGKTIADAALGTFTQTSFPIGDIDEAAFALEANVPSGVLAGAFGPVILRATAITPEIVQPFEELKDQIRTALALNEATGVLLDVHDAFEDALGAGDTLEEAAAKQKLQIVTIDALSASAQRPDDTVITDLPASRDLISGVFETEVGLENAPISVGRNGFVWYQLNNITEARDPELTEVREKVVADWSEAEAARLIIAKAEEIRATIDGGKSMDDVATELSLSPAGEIGLSRDNTSSPIGTEAVRTAFTGPKDSVFTAIAANGTDQIVMKIDVVNRPAADIDALDDQLKTQLESAISDDLLEQLVSRLEGEYPVSYNQAAAQAALAFTNR